VAFNQQLSCEIRRGPPVRCAFTYVIMCSVVVCFGNEILKISFGSKIMIGDIGPNFN